MGFGDIEKEDMAKRFKEEKYESVSEQAHRALRRNNGEAKGSANRMR